MSHILYTFVENKKMNCMKRMKVMLMTMLAGGMMMISTGCVQKVASVADLAGEWEIVEVNNQMVSAEETPFLGFNVAEKQLYGNAGCNSLMGNLETDENQADALSFGALGSTKRMCADMAAEDAILQALGAVKGFALDGEKLVLKGADGSELMELKKKP